MREHVHHAIPDLSPTALGLCGAYFAVGAFSTIGHSSVVASHRPALEELLRHGIVERAPAGDAYRGTPLSVIVGASAMDHADMVFATGRGCPPA